MPLTLNNPYRDDNRRSQYPFADTAKLTAKNGAVLNPSVIVDAMLYPTNTHGYLFLKQIDISGYIATITIGNSDNKDTYSGTYHLNPGAVDADVDGTIILLDADSRPAGVLIVDPLEIKSIFGWPQGITTFGQDVANFVQTCCVPVYPTGINGLKPDGDTALVGDVWLVGENGVVLRKVDTNTIRIDVVGEPLAPRLLCGHRDPFNPPVFLKTINDIQPTAWGAFTLNVGNLLASKPALRITNDGNSILIELAGKTQ